MGVGDWRLKSQSKGDWRAWGGEEGEGGSDPSVRSGNRYFLPRKFRGDVKSSQKPDIICDRGIDRYHSGRLDRRAAGDDAAHSSCCARPLYCFFSLSSSDQLGLETVPAAGKGDGGRGKGDIPPPHPLPSSPPPSPPLPLSTAAGVLGRNLYPINRLLYATAHNEEPGSAMHRV